MEQIQKLTSISENDRDILKDALIKGDINLCREMSIFSKKGKFYKSDTYSFYETDDNEQIYYIGIYFGTDLGIFVDSDKKIIFNSRYYITCSFHHLLINIDKMVNLINKTDITEAIDIGESFVAIQKWFITYGHFKDELFCLADFINKSEYKPIVDFQTDNDVFKHILFNENYKRLAALVFPDGYINSYEYKTKILKFKKLKLIEHNILSPLFHSFPKSVTNSILDSLEVSENNMKKIFVTRGKAMHINRNINNQSDIENFLSEKGIYCLNPENITINKLVQNLRHCDLIFITWGSSLVNIIYAKPDTNIVILKSKSYAHESIDLFNKMIATYKLNISIIETDDDDNINLESLNNLLT